MQFDDLDGADWQPVFDFGNGPGDDTVMLTQVAKTNDMAFYVYDGTAFKKITAFGAIEEGEEASWKATVDDTGRMELFKNDELLVAGKGYVPNDIVREQMLVGESTWDGDGPLIGTITDFEIVTMPDGLPDAVALDAVDEYLIDFPIVPVDEQAQQPEPEDEDLVA